MSGVQPAPGAGRAAGNRGLRLEPGPGGGGGGRPRRVHGAPGTGLSWGWGRDARARAPTSPQTSACGPGAAQRAGGARGARSAEQGGREGVRGRMPGSSWPRGAGGGAALRPCLCVGRREGSAERGRSVFLAGSGRAGASGLGSAETKASGTRPCPGRPPPSPRCRPGAGARIPPSPALPQRGGDRVMASGDTARGHLPGQPPNLEPR